MIKLLYISTKSFSSLKFLNATTDMFKGVHINSSELPNSIEIFNKMIKTSTSEWKQEKKTGIWLEIPNSFLFLLPTALDNGFIYHHCGKNYIMMTKWIGKGESKIPLYCTHYVGCGGIFKKA